MRIVFSFVHCAKQMSDKAKSTTNREEVDEIEEKVGKKLKLLKLETDADTIVNSERCLLADAADAVLCQIFAFLNVKDHWKLSRGSHRMDKISLLPQATPQKIDLRLKMDSNGNINGKLEKQNMERLMKFRPTQLLIPVDGSIKWNNIGQMTSLRELTLGDNSSYSVTLNLRNVQWLSELTRLTKLKMPSDTCNAANLALPSSLIELHLFGTSYPTFAGVFNSKPLLSMTNLSNLQVLKLPNDQYIPLSTIQLGQVFPALRELSLGYLNLPGRARTSLEDLKSCVNLQHLTIGIDSREMICQWESLKFVPSLISLTVLLYLTEPHPDAFRGLCQIPQLEQLKFVPYRRKTKNNIYPALFDLISTERNNSATDSQMMPSLTALSVAPEFILDSGFFLSALSTLKVLELTPISNSYPTLPHLYTLHVSQTNISALKFYKDQVTQVYYNDPLTLKDFDDKSGNILLNHLLAMSKLTTLKLQPSCMVSSVTSVASVASVVSVAGYFRRHLPPTVSVEVDERAEENH